MNTKVVIGIVTGVILVGAGAWYLSSHKPVAEAPVSGNQEPQAQQAKGMGSLGELIAKAGSWKCTVKMQAGEAPSEGVAYIADGKVRADFSSNVAALGGKEVKSSFIQADGYAYTWSDMMPKGIKLPIPSSTDPAVSEATPMDYAAPVEYDCAPWMKDDALFTPPTSVTFMELGKSDMPEALPKAVPQPI